MASNDSDDQQETKYTAIYYTAHHRSGGVSLSRIERREGETVGDMLEREGIGDRTIFLVHGHPKLQGE